MEKRADLGAKSIVSIVLAIMGFVILLFFIFQIITPGTAHKEACHNSVILRGSVPSIAGDFVPLNCKTEKICITSKIIGGKCEDFENSEGVTYIRVKSNEQVEKAIAEGIVDCWSMMGGGNIDLFQEIIARNFGLGTIHSSCVICSRIAFDKESLRKSGIFLENINVERYMMTHEIGDKGISYLDYISGEKRVNMNIALSEGLKFPNLTEVRDEKGNILLTKVEGEGSVMEFEKVDIEAQKKDIQLQNDEIAILFMQISSPKQGESLINILGAATGLGAGGFAVSSSWMVKGAKGVSRFCATGYGTIVCGVALIGSIFVQQANVAANKNIAAGKCSDVSFGEDAREGCSVVRTVNYDAESIGEYCAVIESSV